MLPEAFGSGSFRPCVEDVKQPKAVLMYAMLLFPQEEVLYQRLLLDLSQWAAISP